MLADIFDVDAYKRFADNLMPLLSGKNIKRVNHEDLREPAIKTGTRTKFGSYGWRAAVSSRIAPKTVYLGSPYIRQSQLTDLQKNIVANAPEELHNVLHLMRTIPFVHLRMQIGNNPEFNPVCNLYMSVADAKNYRIPYMWGHTVRKASKDPGPEFTMIHIPEEHNIRQQVLVLPEHNINIALGTDYMGEDKKGFLRQSMWCADELGMLGLHAGTKIVTVLDPHGELRRYGVFMFGLTATGKSTWSCHPLGLDYRAGEGTQVTQDDIVFLKKDGSALGSEDGGFFVKTDVDPNLQEALYNALTDKSALFENVMIDSEGNADFLDETLCANGRSVMKRKKLWIKVGRKKLDISGESIDLPSLDELDGIVFAFITRRNTIMPFAQELTPEQGVLAYLWGESTHSFASQPAKAGESVRIVGTDPFIIGSRGRKVNRFHDIVMHLVEQYPGKVRFFQYNTGGLGEIIEEREEDGIKKKHFIKKAERVPIKLMAAIQRGDLKGVNGYEKGMFGTKQIARVEGEDLARYDPRNFYSQEEIDFYLRDIIEGRMKYTETIAAEGLHDEVIEAADKSFRIMPRRKDKAFVSGSPEGSGSEGGKGGGSEGSGTPGGEEESPVERFWKPAGRMPAPPRHRSR
ncbi:MAG: phosphoenolpyruvate carboxykinase (ATP) [bacterium]